MRQTYLALKLKLVKVSVYETHNTKEVRKEHEEEAKANEETAAEEEQEAPVLLVTHVNNILHSIFSNVEMYINNQQTYNSNGFYAHNLYAHSLIFRTTSRRPPLNTREFCTARGTIMKNFLMKLWKRLSLNVFSQGE